MIGKPCKKVRLISKRPDLQATEATAGTESNTAAARFMRAAESDEPVGRKVRSIVHPDYWELFERRVHRAMVQRLSNPLVEEKFVRCDGSVCEVISTQFVYEGQQALQVAFYEKSGVSIQESGDSLAGKQHH